MTENVYAPPQAHLQNLADNVERESMFYVVSKKKFLTLYFGTLGYYSIYWAYKNWKEYKRSTGTNIAPALRAIFMIFFTHSLFRRVEECIKGNRTAYTWTPQASATWVVALTFVSNILDRLPVRNVGSPYLELAPIAILLPLGFAYVKPQLAINAACADPEGASNSSLTGSNYIFLALGIPAWCLVLIGLVSILR